MTAPRNRGPPSVIGGDRSIEFAPSHNPHVNLSLESEQEMADPISTIELNLWTSLRDGSSTDGRVYLGIGGREYAVARDDVDDFEPRPDPVTYIFGHGGNVRRPQDNDPRSPWQTDANDLTRCPKYLRFAPEEDDDNWDVERADLSVSFKGTAPGSVEQTISFSRLGSGPHLWLGVQRGLYLHFS
jgi:hypothetical protein